MKFCYFGSLSKKIHSIRIKLSHGGGGGGGITVKAWGGGSTAEKSMLESADLNNVFFYGSISYHAANHCFANK